MVRRCNDPKNKDYKNYGARGITVCREWSESFDNFLRDMGEKPEGLTIERINNNLPYMKGNCVWADRLTQIRNRRKPMRHR